MRRLFILLCLAAPAALLTGCADLSRPEQITVVAERAEQQGRAAPETPPDANRPILERGQGMAPMPAGQGASPPRAGGG
ncbi:MAG: hypothetical protein WKG00_16145 [Polyangiaceae bacterium]